MLRANKTTVYDGWCTSRTAGPIFHGRYLHSRDSVGAKKRRLWKHLAESVPKTYGSVLASSWLSSNRAWKTSPGGCVIFTVVYDTLNCEYMQV